ncbi:hypothetical protein QA645_32275 [Bradyrhizobium sp. CIAT3101]|uniref:hypothetical protein n=1 Tax=Bradyrhizobium sp. CIAT3101 TaxID=439387 RepID=UPI0024B10846|nr:hypothetical protein [Bradyrhizobium sp. CIAT3101]WFU79174.1 hypothetical protein QA645_32275 [Bradyrhizobium sp. CIAT3101]
MDDKGRQQTMSPTQFMLHSMEYGLDALRVATIVPALIGAVRYDGGKDYCEADLAHILVSCS